MNDKLCDSFDRLFYKIEKLKGNKKINLEINDFKYIRDLCDLENIFTKLVDISVVNNIDLSKWWDNIFYQLDNVKLINTLTKNFRKDFRAWWNKEIFLDNKKSQKELEEIICKLAENYFYFDLWWDDSFIEVFKTNHRFQLNLILYCHDHFDKWWVFEFFNWEYLHYLLINCVKHFEKWWDESLVIEKIKHVGEKIYRRNKKKFNYFTQIVCLDLIRNYPNYYEKWKNLLKEFIDEIEFDKYTVEDIIKNLKDKVYEIGILDKIDYKKMSKILIDSCYDEFDIWWNSEKFNWKDNSAQLAYFLKNCDEEEFKEIWDTEKYNWKSCSYHLAINCWMHFDIWWDKNKYFLSRKKDDRITKFVSLMIYVPDKIDIWWDDRIFRKIKDSYFHFGEGLYFNSRVGNFNESRNMKIIDYMIINYSHKSDLWLKKEYIDYNIKTFELLVEYCKNEFEIWWDKKWLDTYGDKIVKYYLFSDLEEYENIWKEDYLIWKMLNN